MESPERSSMAAAVAEDQGSPLFNFLCSLSPIKVVKSVHVAQTLAEFNFPPPPTVFVTPRVDSRRDARTLKKKGSYNGNECLQSVVKDCEDSAQNDIRQPLVDADIRIQGKRKAASQVKDNVCNSPCNSPSKLVDQYLAEPMEVEPRTAKEELDAQKEIVDGNQDGKIESEKQNGGIDDLKDAQLIESLRSTHLEAREIKENKFVLQLDKETSGLVFFMSDDTEKQPVPVTNLSGWGKQSSSALSGTPKEQVPTPFTSGEEIGSGNAKYREMDCTLTQMETNAQASIADDADSVDHPGIGANKVNLPTQRGFRRRCLDFEEGQVKSKSSPTLFKQMDANNYDIRSENPVNSIPDQLYVLKERIFATSGAINSDTAMVEDTEEGSRLNANHLHGSMHSLKDPHHSNHHQHSFGTSSVPENIHSSIGKHSSSNIPSSQSSLSSTSSGSTPPSRSSSDGYSNFVPSGNHCYLLNIGSEGLNSFVSLMGESKERECSLQPEGSELPVTSIEQIQFEEIGTEHPQESSQTYGFEEKPCLLGQRTGSQLELGCQMESNGQECSDQSPPSPKKKRRSTSSNDKSSGGCKRCNCKKSKCLKLYCECFAAGVYCVDSCSCQGCQNKPEFEEVVLETRQQIESRNPLAFAPKVVLAVSADSTPSTTMENNSGDTPSARHKRGCNCKKSKCLKKYCECFQAGVGCSDGCRCEDCQNIHGRKEGFKDSDEKDASIERDEKEAIYEKVVADHGNDIPEMSHQQHHNLSPITPSLEHMGQNRSVLMSRSASKRRFAYDELHSPPFLLSSSKPPKTPSRLLRSSKETENTILPTPGRCLSGSPISTPDLFGMDQFSPRWDGLGDICTLTPLHQVPNRAVPASVSKLDEADDSSPSINIQQCDSLRGSDHKMFACQSSRLAHCTSSPMYPSKVSPLTPAFKDVQASATGSKASHEDSEALDQKFAEDVPPEILKDSEAACSPICQIKASSPKRKRVSPPTRETLHGNLQSPASRNVRKFILRSVPSTPNINGS